MPDHASVTNYLPPANKGSSSSENDIADHVMRLLESAFHPFISRREAAQANTERPMSIGERNGNTGTVRTFGGGVGRSVLRCRRNGRPGSVMALTALINRAGAEPFSKKALATTPAGTQVPENAPLMAITWIDGNR